MKYVILILTVLTLSSNVLSQTPKVYVNYVTHNETNYTQYLLDSSFYVNARTNLIQFGLDCQAKGAKWSMGNDYIMLDAILQWDAPPLTANTSGKNLLRYLNEDLGVECDPHAHANVFPYQDVAYKHTLLGVAPSSVISGYLADTLDDSGYWWKDYENPVQSALDMSFSWHPEVLWGGATLGHINDSLYHGMWKPNDTTDFYTHNPANRLISYGNGCRIKIKDTSTVAYVVDQIDVLLDDIENGTLPATGFYPMSIFVAEFYLWDPAFLLKLAEITDSINVRVAQGRMEWMHIEDVVDEWKTTYDTVGFYASCDNQHFIGIEEDEISENFSIFPNPANSWVTISPNSPSNYSFGFYNTKGELLRQEFDLLSEFDLSLEAYSKGVYFLKIESEEYNFVRKVIKD